MSLVGKKFRYPVGRNNCNPEIVVVVEEIKSPTEACSGRIELRIKKINDSMVSLVDMEKFLKESEPILEAD